MNQLGYLCKPWVRAIIALIITLTFTCIFFFAQSSPQRTYAGNREGTAMHYGPVGLKLKGGGDKVTASAVIIDENEYYELVQQGTMSFCWDSEAGDRTVYGGSEYEINTNGSHYLNVYISDENGSSLYCTMEFEVDSIEEVSQDNGEGSGEESETPPEEPREEEQVAEEDPAPEEQPPAEPRENVNTGEGAAVNEGSDVPGETAVTNPPEISFSQEQGTSPGESITNSGTNAINDNNTAKVVMENTGKGTKINNKSGNTEKNTKPSESKNNNNVASQGKNNNSTAPSTEEKVKENVSASAAATGSGYSTAKYKDRSVSSPEIEEEEEDDIETVSSNLESRPYLFDEDEDPGDDAEGSEEDTSATEIRDAQDPEFSGGSSGNSEEELLPGLLRQDKEKGGFSVKTGKIIMIVLILILLTALTLFLLFRKGIIVLPEEEPDEEHSESKEDKKGIGRIFARLRERMV